MFCRWLGGPTLWIAGAMSPPDHPFPICLLSWGNGMYLLYVDDSGSTLDSSQKFFVFGGLAVFERQPHWIATKLDGIAARFNPADPASVEFHGSPMLNGSKGWRAFPLPDRIAAIKDALTVFRDSTDANRAFAVAVNKAYVSPRDPVEVAFEQICSRFDQYLMRLHKAGDTQRGILIFDESTQETTLQQLATDFRTLGHSFGTLRNLAEVPLFIDSRASRLVQLADLIAYATFRHVERGDDQFFTIIADRFDKQGGVIHGFKVLDQRPPLLADEAESTCLNDLSATAP